MRRRIELTARESLDRHRQSAAGRYLLPFVRRFEGAGHDVLLTARAYGDTFAILRNEGAIFEPVGSSFGKGLARKGYGLGRRALQLVNLPVNKRCTSISSSPVRDPPPSPHETRDPAFRDH